MLKQYVGAQKPPRGLRSKQRLSVALARRVKQEHAADRRARAEAARAGESVGDAGVVADDPAASTSEHDESDDVPAIEADAVAEPSDTGSATAA